MQFKIPGVRLIRHEYFTLRWPFGHCATQAAGIKHRGVVVNVYQPNTNNAIARLWTWRTRLICCHNIHQPVGETKWQVTRQGSSQGHGPGRLIDWEWLQQDRIVESQWVDGLICWSWLRARRSVDTIADCAMTRRVGITCCDLQQWRIHT